MSQKQVNEMHCGLMVELNHRRDTFRCFFGGGGAHHPASQVVLSCLVVFSVVVTVGAYHPPPARGAFAAAAAFEAAGAGLLQKRSYVRSAPSHVSLAARSMTSR